MRRLARLHELPSAVLVHHILVVRLHEIGYAATRSRIQHLLAVLAVLSHHLVMLLLLLELVVEGLELGALVVGPRREHSVYVLTQGHLWTESVHLVVVAVGRQTHVVQATAPFWLLCTSRELVKVGSLLRHAHLTTCHSVVVSD